MPSTQYFYTETLLDDTGDYVTRDAVDNPSFALIFNWYEKSAERWEDHTRNVLEWNPHLETLAKKLQQFDKDNGEIEIVCKNSNELEDLLNGDTKTLYYVGHPNATRVIQPVNL